MKKVVTYGVVLIIVALGAYFLFFKGSGGLKLQEVTSTTSGNSKSVSTSSISKTPVEGLVLEKGSAKITVTKVSEDEVTFTMGVKKDSNNCVSGSDTETFTVKKGDKITLNDCTNQDKTYNISF